MAKPSLNVTVRLARNRQTLTDHVVLGLVTGGLLGPGLVVEGRESTCVRFRKTGGFLTGAPDRGEILISTDAGGETKIECRVWCWSLVVRWLLVGLGCGVVVGGVATLAGLAQPAPIVVGVAVATLWHVAAYFLGRWRMRRQIEAFLHNTTYLKAF